jgi:hypothetical protein
MRKQNAVLVTRRLRYSPPPWASLFAAVGADGVLLSYVRKVLVFDSKMRRTFASEGLTLPDRWSADKCQETICTWPWAKCRLVGLWRPGRQEKGRFRVHVRSMADKPIFHPKMNKSGSWFVLITTGYGPDSHVGDFKLRKRQSSGFRPNRNTGPASRRHQTDPKRPRDPTSPSRLSTLRRGRSPTVIPRQRNMARTRLVALGKKGGDARAANLTAEKRSAIAKKAAEAVGKIEKGLRRSKPLPLPIKLPIN